MQPSYPNQANFNAPVIVYYQNPSDMCYYSGCNTTATAICTHTIFCKQIGCQRKICARHTSKEIYAKDKHSVSTICKDCEPKAAKASRTFLYYFFLPFFICGCTCFIFAILKNVNEKGLWTRWSTDVAAFWEVNQWLRLLKSFQWEVPY